MCFTRGIIVPIDEHICSDRFFNHHVHAGIFSTQELNDLSRNLDESLEGWGNHWQHRNGRVHPLSYLYDM